MLHASRRQHVDIVYLESVSRRALALLFLGHDVVGVVVLDDGGGVRVLEDVGEVAVLVRELGPLGGGVVVAHARRGGHDGDRLVVAQLAAALAALEDGDEAAAVLFVEKDVDEGIDGRVARAEPLRDGRRYPQHLVLPFRRLATQL